MEYNKEYCKKMLNFFTYGDGKALPSFPKFAFSIGAHTADLERWRQENGEFAMAYEECVARLCDMLKDGALVKRFDSSFVKFLLSSKYGFSESEEEAGDDTPFEVKITVMGTEKKEELENGDKDNN